MDQRRRGRTALPIAWYATTLPPESGGMEPSLIWRISLLALTPSPVRLHARAFGLCLAVALSAGLASCGGDKELTADSTCREFLNRPADERSDAAIRISTELEGVSNPGNPMWAASVSAACGSAPAATLRETYGGGFARGDRSDAEDDKSSAEGAAAPPEPEPTPGANGSADGETVAAVFAAAPALNERIYAMEWQNGKLILDVANVAEAEEYCADIKLATGATSIAARQASDQTRLC